MMKRRNFLKIMAGVVPAVFGVRAIATPRKDFPWKGISQEVTPDDILAARDLLDSNPEPLRYDLRTDPFEEIGTVAWKQWHSGEVLNKAWKAR